MKAVAVAAALLLSACANYTLVPPSQPVAVAKSTLVVTPASAWNRLGGDSPGKHAERWTLDGVGLNELTFYAGIEDGQPLFRDFDKRNAPLPRFSVTMLPTDVAALFESSYRIAAGTALFELRSVEPASFAGRPGFRIRYAFTVQDEEVRRDGEAAGAIVDGRLYLIAFEAPAIFYFDRDVAAYRAIVASARFTPPRP